MKIRVSIAGLLATAPLAMAQPSGAQAEVLFRRGKELLAKGQFAEACAAFDASQKLDQTTGTLLNQANCREKNGQLATAWGLFLEAKRKTASATDAANKGMHKTAIERSTKLEARLSTLTINVPEGARVSGLEILRDSEVLEPVMWNKALPLDGGTYRVSARAPGNTEWSATITIGTERDSKAIDIPTLRRAELVPPTVTEGPEPRYPSVVATVPATPIARVEAPPESARRSRLPIYVGAGALAALGAGLAFELRARSTQDRSTSELDRTKQLELYDSANLQRHVAQGFVIAGVATAGVATWLYVRERGKRSTTMSASLTSNTAALVVGGGF